MFSLWDALQRHRGYMSFHVVGQERVPTHWKPEPALLESQLEFFFLAMREHIRDQVRSAFGNSELKPARLDSGFDNLGL